MSGSVEKLSGAPASAAASTYLVRMTLCGQTKLQLPHWMHVSGSHSATNSEIRRFSYVVVPLGKVPSTGMALTGRALAAARHHRGGHRADELRRGVRDDQGAWACPDPAAAGTGISAIAAAALSTAVSLRRTTSWPRLP